MGLELVNGTKNTKLDVIKKEEHSIESDFR